MREAQKMMNDPAFQAQMKKMTENPAFQAHMKQQQEMLQDPEKVKELEEKMQARLKEGEELLAKANLLAAKINPDTDMKRIAFSGAHDATVAAVAGGKVDAGALNISVWEKLLAQGKVDATKVRVFYTTPGYFDYNWTVRADMDPALRKKLSDAFLALDMNNPQDKEILDLQRASRFIPTKAENYLNIEKAALSAGLLK